MNIVVGSGPSGVSAASALLDAGREVLMLDVGRALEPERASLAAGLASRAPGEWTADDLRRVREPMDAAWTPKRSFGSAYPYAMGPSSGLDQKGTRCMVSEARGGLSSVWGAAVLPFPEDELDDWPVKPEALRPYYRKAASMLGIAGAADELAARFPYHVPPSPPLKSSLQAGAVLARFSASAPALKDAGFSWGRARHAVRADRCREASLCLTGCPYGAIWNAADAVESLKKRPGFRYESGVRVLRLETRADGIRLHAARQGAPRAVYDATKAFLACGPLATARLVLGSFGAPESPLALKVQPYFLLPLLMDRAVPGAPEPELHTLAQIFLELSDPEVSKRFVHMQIYGHNEFIASRLRLFPRFVARRLESRLLAIQGYLHSDESDSISVTPRGSGEDCRLELAAPSRARTKAAVRRAAARLAERSRDLGFLPMRFLLKHGLPGEGNHVGGIFPMKTSPYPWETDALGRLGGEGAVHLVDSSVLPSLPATTFTYGVMANAARIATEAVS